ncbi:MAG: hypothetical protein AAGP08_00880 [Pseudomonadota bacterium]
MLKSTEEFAALAATLTAEGVPTDLLKWLTRLKLLIGVPFNYLVPDNDYLPPETIRFFYIDPNWVNALADGALSIGRHFNGTDTAPATEPAEIAQAATANAQPTMCQGNHRLAQLNLTEVAPDATAVSKVRTGFILNSDAVKSWKNIDVAGYPKGQSPYDYEEGVINETSDIVPLKILRLVRLSSSVMLGIFEGDLYELVLHQPPDEIHFGFKTVTLDTAEPKVTKNLRVPTSNWDNPDTKYDGGEYQDVPLTGIFADADARVVDMMATSKALGAALKSTGPNGAPGYYSATPNPDQKDHLVASDFGLEMVLGVGLVSYINK